MALIIDVETTGLPYLHHLPHGHYPSYKNLDMYDTARIVQISMMICNESFEMIEMKNFIIKADGFTINNSEFHGITNEISKKDGVLFSEVVIILSKYIEQVSHIVAHNIMFDINIICSELFRLGEESVIYEINKKQLFCTMKHCKQMVNVRNMYGVKFPSLAELYSYVFKKTIENAHNSEYDVINLHKIIKFLFDNNKIKLI